MSERGGKGKKVFQVHDADELWQLEWRTGHLHLRRDMAVCALAEEGSFVLSPPPLSLALRFDAPTAPNRKRQQQHPRRLLRQLPIRYPDSCQYKY